MRALILLLCLTGCGPGEEPTIDVPGVLAPDAGLQRVYLYPAKAPCAGVKGCASCHEACPPS